MTNIEDLAEMIATAINRGEAEKDARYDNVFRFKVDELDYEFPTDSTELADQLTELYDAIMDVFSDLNDAYETMRVNLPDSDDDDDDDNYYYDDEIVFDEFGEPYRGPYFIEREDGTIVTGDTRIRYDEYSMDDDEDDEFEEDEDDDDEEDEEDEEEDNYPIQIKDGYLMIIL